MKFDNLEVPSNNSSADFDSISGNTPRPEDNHPTNNEDDVEMIELEAPEKAPKKMSLRQLLKHATNNG